MTADELRVICGEHGIVVSMAGMVRERDVARLLDVDTRTLQRWRLDGIGPAPVAIGRSWLYSVTEIAATLTPDDKRRHPRIDDSTEPDETQASFSRRVG